MPANLTPEYKAAEAAFRKARDHRERLRLLREMLRVIPKHKGTDHLQGDIDIHFQLVDLPAVSPEHPVTWLGSTLVVRTGMARELSYELSGPEPARLVAPAATARAVMKK